ncbi:NAD(+) diphosphatase [Planctomonas psychrotolerans]|uniref:NAD(+) diphosphatase n=1 Tax=Planctomonas psychrotolerans TaxID=2528712 RepID=UPI00123B9D49|nr:NAD(+) diphosphatase [Planctomonas psychrotolerans]
MSKPFLQRLPLSRQEVDRDYLARSRPDLFDELWADPTTRVLPLWKGLTLGRVDPVGEDEFGEHERGEMALDLKTTDEVPSAVVRIYLGRTTTAAAREPAGTRVVTSVLSDAAARELEPDEALWINLRDSATQFSPRDAGLFTEALAIANWHSSHTYSPRTGEPTIVGEGGWVRRSPSDGSEVFPRTDAAIIVGVIDDEDRILLGANANWGGTRYSLLAGFVEPGESFEAAVVREIFEESGITVTDPKYLGSQPWPFPASIMVGFTARLDTTADIELKPDGTEIIDLRWFSRADIDRAEVGLPGRSSIARAILEEWYGGPIPDGASR